MLTNPGPELAIADSPSGPTPDGSYRTPAAGL